MRILIRRKKLKRRGRDTSRTNLTEFPQVNTSASSHSETRDRKAADKMVRSEVETNADPS